MKKFFLIALFSVSGIFAQNFQLHYDMGKDRHYFTSTFEMFKPDEYGSTFLFVDVDFDNPGNRSASLAYFEIARYINIPWFDGLSATIQYNDGTAPWGPLGHIWLVGVSYPVDLGFVTLNTDILYRKDYLSSGSDAQLTSVWFVPFFDGFVTFTGFIDIWTAQLAGKSGKDVVVLTEPQIWFSVQKHLFLGSEVEISKNFLPSDKVEVMPTIAFKWEF